MNPELIAPCGMNCGICLGYLREKNSCSGCRSSSEKKPNQCKKCIIISCAQLHKTESKFCYDCLKFPCTRLKQLDKRYRTKYNMSMLENLDNIRKGGIENFVHNEEKRWRCSGCGGSICVHSGFCLSCKVN